MSNAAPRTQADLIQLFEPVRDDLEAVEREFARQVQSQIHVIPEIGNYLLKSGGKRVRPAVLLMAALLSCYIGPRAVLHAAVVELVALDNADITFGEIEDEDTEDEEIIEIIEGADGYWDVLGSTEIDKIERLFDIELEDDDFTTIAGMITSESGYVPKPGEQLNLRGLEIEILRADDKKIAMVRLRKAEPAGDEAETVEA